MVLISKIIEISHQKYHYPTILIIGIGLSSVGLFLASSPIYYSFCFAIFFLSAYLYTKRIEYALFLTAVYSIPYSLGKSIFFVEDGYIFRITPFTSSVIILSFFSVRKYTSNISLSPDILLLLFFIWGFLSTLINSSREVISGLITLGIYILFYFMAKRYMKYALIGTGVKFILLSLVIFESLLAITQFIIGHPIGMLIEQGSRDFPYGRLIDEGQIFIRAMGTFSHPTLLSRFLTIIFPLVLFDQFSVVFQKKIKFAVIPIMLLAIFFTFTRFSWMMTLLIFIIYIVIKKPRVDVKRLKLVYIIPFCFLLFIVGLQLFPYFNYKISVSSQAFDEYGSIDWRIKLVYESISLISQFPLFGVGLNRFVEYAAKNNVTGIYGFFPTAEVHNIFLRIASEMGIPALIFFSGFILISYLNYIKQRAKSGVQSEIVFKDAVALGGLIYIFESNMNAWFLGPPTLLFLLYMAILNEKS